MKRATYPLNSRNIGKTAWFYESKKGIDVVAQLLGPNDEVLGTTVTPIGWKHIEAALKNHRKIVRQRKARS